MYTRCYLYLMLQSFLFFTRRMLERAISLASSDPLPFPYNSARMRSRGKVISRVHLSLFLLMPQKYARSRVLGVSGSHKVVLCTLHIENHENLTFLNKPQVPQMVLFYQLRLLATPTHNQCVPIAHAPVLTGNGR